MEFQEIVGGYCNNQGTEKWIMKVKPEATRLSNVTSFS